MATKRGQTVADLKAARALIAKEGWVQGVEYSSNGGYCAIGAVMEITGYLSVRYRRADAHLRAVLPPSSDHVTLKLTRWNDEPGRTKRQVLALYTRAIEHAEAARRT